MQLTNSDIGVSGRALMINLLFSVSYTSLFMTITSNVLHLGCCVQLYFIRS